MQELNLIPSPDVAGELCLSLDEQIALGQQIHDMMMSWGITWLIVGLFAGTVIMYIWMRRCYGDPVFPL